MSKSKDNPPIHEIEFYEREKKVGFDQALREDHEEALKQHQERSFTGEVPEVEVELEENKNFFWRNFFSIVAATIILIVGYMIWAINVDDSGFTKVNNRLNAIENRIGVFSTSDKDTISEKLTALGNNQVTLQKDLAATVDDVDTNIKTIKSVRTIAYNNKKKIGNLNKKTNALEKKTNALEKKTNALVVKVNTKDTRIKTLQSLVSKLKHEECSRTFRMNDTDLCK